MCPIGKKRGGKYLKMYVDTQYMLPDNTVLSKEKIAHSYSTNFLLHKAQQSHLIIFRLDAQHTCAKTVPNIIFIRKMIHAPSDIMIFNSELNPHERLHEIHYLSTNSRYFYRSVHCTTLFNQSSHMHEDKRCLYCIYTVYRLVQSIQYPSDL